MNAMQNVAGVQKPTESIGFRAYLLMTVLSVFYLYSVNVWNINVSLFKMALLITFILTVVGLLFGRIKTYRTYMVIYFFILADLALSALDAYRSKQNPLILKIILDHIAALSVLWLSVLQLNNENRVLKTIKWYAYSSVFAAGITIYTYVTGNMPFPQFVVNLAGTDISLTTMPAEFLGIIPRAAAAFYDPTFYGLFLCICLCFSIFYKTWIAKNKLVNLLIIVNVIMLAATLSRTAWIGALVLAIFVCIYISRSRLYLVAIGLLSLAAIMGIVLSIGMYGSHGLGKVTDLTSLKSLESREMYWDAGVSEFFAHPLSGGGSKELGKAVGGTPSAHIVYLSWLAKYGIIGFFIYCAFFFYPIIYAFFKRSLLLRYRFLILGVMCPMAIMYFGYDLFNQLNIEYLAFGIIYAVILNRIGLRQNSVTVNVPAKLNDSLARNTGLLD